MHHRSANAELNCCAQELSVIVATKLRSRTTFNGLEGTLVGVGYRLLQALYGVAKPILLRQKSPGSGYLGVLDDYHMLPGPCRIPS